MLQGNCRTAFLMWEPAHNPFPSASIPQQRPLSAVSGCSLFIKCCGASTRTQSEKKECSHHRYRGAHSFREPAWKGGKQFMSRFEHFQRSCFSALWGHFQAIPVHPANCFVDTVSGGAEEERSIWTRYYADTSSLSSLVGMNAAQTDPRNYPHGLTDCIWIFRRFFLSLFAKTVQRLWIIVFQRIALLLLFEWGYWFFIGPGSKVRK